MGFRHLPRRNLRRNPLSVLSGSEGQEKADGNNPAYFLKGDVSTEDAVKAIIPDTYEAYVPYAYDEAMTERRLQKIQEHAGMELDELQREAVLGAVQNGVFILTGGPGTGKTTTINAMIRYFESEGLDIMLLSKGQGALNNFLIQTYFQHHRK